MTRSSWPKIATVLVASVALVSFGLFASRRYAARVRANSVIEIDKRIATFVAQHGRIPNLTELGVTPGRECDFEAYGTCLHYCRQESRYYLIEYLGFDESIYWDSVSREWNKRG